MSAPEIITGGMTAYRTQISQEEQAVFKKATERLLGVQYAPVAVATQVVNGINYSFFCNTKGLYVNAPNQAAMVDIYAPPGGDPHITGIHQVQH